MKPQNCFDCDAEIDATELSSVCPICHYGPICSKCVPTHLEEIHPGEDIPEPPPPEAYIPTPEHRQNVRMMSACHLSIDNMAYILGCKRSELKKHYKFEIENGDQHVVFKVADRLYEEAMKGNVTALIFILKTKGDWREDVPGEQTDDAAQALVKGLNQVERGQRLLRIMRQETDDTKPHRRDIPEVVS